jgi:hypothetical protein
MVGPGSQRAGFRDCACVLHMDASESAAACVRRRFQAAAATDEVGYAGRDGRVCWRAGGGRGFRWAGEKRILLQVSCTIMEHEKPENYTSVSSLVEYSPCGIRIMLVMETRSRIGITLWSSHQIKVNEFQPLSAVKDITR